MLAPQVLGYRTYPAKEGGVSFRCPVVLVRGLGRSSGFWLEFVDALTPRARVVTVDLLGTGLSPSSTGRGRIEEFAADLVETFRRERLLPCHLVGISLGGMVCLEAAAQLARERPSFDPGSVADVASLTVLASSARFTKEPRISPAAVAQLLYALRRPIPRNREFAHWLVSAATLAARPDLPEIWDGVWEKEGFAKLAVVRQLLAAAFFDGRKALDLLRQPAFFLVSRDDGLVSWRNTLRLWERAAGSRLHVMTGAGHDFPTERPLETAALLHGFFQDVETGLQGAAALSVISSRHASTSVGTELP
jgi:3-oxoadipate enol-lactonase